MRLDDFDFNLPKELIAKHPVDPRDAAKILVVERKTGKTQDKYFYDLPDLLKPDDFLVFNNSKVIPARLFGESKGIKFEVLLTKEADGKKWECLIKPARKVKINIILDFGAGLLGTVLEKKEDVFIVEFNKEGSNFWNILEKNGEVPLPPYILKQRGESHSEKTDLKDYQTVFARKPGSAAAPTAGLHFTNELLDAIERKGCGIGYVDLHVGLGTFEPIRTENIEDFRIHSEHFELSEELAERLNKAKSEGRRIIAVGTTSVRVLESCQKNGILFAKSDETNIYIYPGYKFGFVDAMITNFHTPKSSLLVLVSAFYNQEKILEVYKEAKKKNYRFYSYGDGMFIV